MKLTLKSDRRQTCSEHQLQSHTHFAQGLPVFRGIVFVSRITLTHSTSNTLSQDAAPSKGFVFLEIIADTPNTSSRFCACYFMFFIVWLQCWICRSCCAHPRHGNTQSEKYRIILSRLLYIIYPVSTAAQIALSDENHVKTITTPRSRHRAATQWCANSCVRPLIYKYVYTISLKTL